MLNAVNVAILLFWKAQCQMNPHLEIGAYNVLGCNLFKDYIMDVFMDAILKYNRWNTNRNNEMIPLIFNI